MRPLLDRAADGRSRGLGTMYALAHAARCPRCQRYLDSLRELTARLRETRDQPSAGEAEALRRLKDRLR